MLNRRRFRTTRLSPAILLILWGCQTTILLVPGELGPGNGRADRTYEEPVARVIPAVFKALDDHSISPLRVTFLDAEGDTPLDVEDASESRKNSLILKNRDVLKTKKIDLPDGSTKPFEVGAMSYTGKTLDGHHVAILVKTNEEDTEVSARIGRIGDHRRARALLDSVTGRLEADWKIPTPEAEQEKPRGFKRTLPSER